MGFPEWMVVCTGREVGIISAIELVLIIFLSAELNKREQAGVHIDITSQ